LARLTAHSSRWKKAELQKRKRRGRVGGKGQGRTELYKSRIEVGIQVVLYSFTS